MPWQSPMVDVFHTRAPVLAFIKIASFDASPGGACPPLPTRICPELGPTDNEMISSPSYWPYCPTPVSARRWALKPDTNEPELGLISTSPCWVVPLYFSNRPPAYSVPLVASKECTSPRLVLFDQIVEPVEDDTAR